LWKGVTQRRYIIRKPTNWDVDTEEQNNYERKSDYFVTSQTTEPPDDSNPGPLSEFRFGVDECYPRNYVLPQDLALPEGTRPIRIPVHDGCWKIFERVLKLRLGDVDLQGFMALWRVCVWRILKLVVKLMAS